MGNRLIKILLSFVVIVLLLAGVTRQADAACVWGDAGYCTKNSDCDWNERCGGGSCCVANSTGCGSAAAPACNGWCAAGSSCKAKNGSCSCETTSTCSDVNPDAPVLTYPDDDAEFAPNINGTATVALAWQEPANWGNPCTGSAKTYQVRVGPTGGTLALVATITDGSDADSVPDATTYNYTGNAGTSYDWRIVAVYGSASRTSLTRTFTVTPLNQVSGDVYLDAIPNACSTANPQNVGGALVATWSSVATVNRYLANVNTAYQTYTQDYSAVGSVNAAGHYTITNIQSGVQCSAPPNRDRVCVTYPTTGTLTLSGLPGDYSCESSCSACPVKTGVPSTSAGNSFFVNQAIAKSSWWQAVGAGVYAGSTGGESIKSLLPTSVSRLILASGTSNAGAVFTASTTAPNLGTDGGALSDEGWIASTRYRGKRIDYAYFALRLGLTASRVSDWGSSDNLSQPVYDASKVFYYMKPPSGTAVLNSAWTLSSPEKYIVFVDGDLRINSDITIPVGQFAAFIVKGKIVVDPAVSDIAGLFVANQIFQTDHVASGDDIPLVVQGSVVTWSGVSLNRDLGSLNYSTPAEKFVYRPDLLVNMPDAMKSFALNWHEVAPGTFGN